MIIIYKSIEQIRKECANISQTEFANNIGMSFRSYQERLQGKRKEWKFLEIAKASEYNKGKILVITDEGAFECNFKRVENVNKKIG